MSTLVPPHALAVCLPQGVEPELPVTSCVTLDQTASSRGWCTDGDRPESVHPCAWPIVGAQGMHRFLNYRLQWAVPFKLPSGLTRLLSPAVPGVITGKHQGLNMCLRSEPQLWAQQKMSVLQTTQTHRNYRAVTTFQEQTTC